MKRPKNPFHAGEILLEEFLKPANITQTTFVKKIGWARACLNELIKGKRNITAEMALDLARTLGTTAKLWMNLQVTYNLNQAVKRRKVRTLHTTRDFLRQRTGTAKPKNMLKYLRRAPKVLPMQGDECERPGIPGFMRAEYDFSKGKRGALIPSKDKTCITIYIDDVVLDEFRVRAELAGTGYQTMMNEALKAFLEKYKKRG